MAHEKSITVKKEGKTGKYFVKDNSGANKGAILGNKKGYRTMQEANAYAKARSEEHGRLSKKAKGGPR